MKNHNDNDIDGHNYNINYEENYNLIISSLSYKALIQTNFYNNEIKKLLNYMNEDIYERLSDYILLRCKEEYTDYLDLFDSNFKLKHDKSIKEMTIINRKWEECFENNNFKFVRFTNKLESEYNSFIYKNKYYQDLCIDESNNNLDSANICYDNFMKSAQIAFQNYIDVSSKYLLELNKNLPRI